MNKRLIVFFSIITVAMLLFGCSVGQIAETAPAAPPQAPMAAPDMGYDAGYSYENFGTTDKESLADKEIAGAGSASSSGGAKVELIVPDTNRKIILTQSLGIQTKNYDDDKNKIVESLKLYNGFIQYSNESGTKPQNMYDSGRVASFAFRVPQQNAEGFVASLNGVGEIIYSNSSGQDVTQQYTDIELRLKTLETRYDRLLSLLNKAERLEDVALLEAEIGNVTYEIESLKGQQRGLDDLIQYVTVNVELMEVNTIAGAMNTNENDTFDEKLSKSFYSVLNGFISFLEGFAIAIISILPVIIPLGAIAWGIVWIVKVNKKRKQQRKQLLEASKNEEK